MKENTRGEITYPTSCQTTISFVYFPNNLKYYDNMFLILNWPELYLFYAQPQLKTGWRSRSALIFKGS